MRMTNCVVLLLAAVAGQGASAAGPQSTDGLDLTWNTIDGGGIMRSSGGPFELSGTFGQIDAGRAGDGKFELTGGFWFELVPADCNADGSVTLFDFVDFAACMLGPDFSFGGGQPCACFDLDGNGSVDLSDFTELQMRFQGR